MTPLKVAWDNWFASQDKGGTAGYAARLLKHLDHRDDVRIESLHGGGPRRSRLLRNVSSFYWTHLHLPSILVRGRFDLLHAPAFIAPIVSPCPVVVTVHDVTPFLFPSHFAGSWVSYFKLFMPRVLRSAAAIVCGSACTKREIIRLFGTPQQKIWVTPYGVEHDRFHAGATLDSGLARQLGLRPGYLLHVGALVERKNIPTLLRAVAQLQSVGKLGSRQLLLVGSEARGMAGVDEILETINKLNLSENVVLAGHVPDEYIPGLYAHAGIVVVPSLYEGFGFPILEAMATGTPVVASNTSSIPEVAGDAAILFPPHDAAALAHAIGEILDNATLEADLRKRGFAQAAKFTWERTAAETIAVYQSVVRR